MHGLRKGLVARARQIVLLAALLVPLGAASEGNPLTPLTLPGGQVVSVVELKSLMASGGVALFDMRNPINFGRGHLPNARALPYQERSEPKEDFDAVVDSFEIGALPANRDHPIVFYSHGDTGWKSYKAARQAISAGYTRVSWFRGGLAAWQAAGEAVVR